MRERTDVAAEAEDSSGGGEKLGRAIRIAQLKKLVAQEQEIQQRIKINEGVYIKRAESEEKQAQKFRAIRIAWQQLPKALRQALADAAGDPLQCETILQDALRAMSNAFAEDPPTQGASDEAKA